MRASAVLCLVVMGACVSGHAQRNTVDSKGSRYWEYTSIDGIPDGKSQTYNPDGQLRTEGYFLNAQFHGLHVAYYPDGTIIHKSFFWFDVLVWKSYSPGATPPEELLAALAPFSDPIEIRRRFGSTLQVTRRQVFALDTGAPTASFLTTDRAALPGERVTMQVGMGGGTSRLASAMRYSMFGKISRRDFGAFLRVDGSSLSSTFESTTERLAGRQTLEAGATYDLAAPIGRLVSRLSMVVPLGHDDANGFLAGAATVFQRPADAILSVPSTSAIRSSISSILGGHRWILQNDVGFDLALGGPAGETAGYARMNSALGFGMRSVLVSVELSNAMGITSLDDRLHSLGAGAALSSYGITVKGLIARTTGSHTTVSLATDYEF